MEKFQPEKVQNNELQEIEMLKNKNLSLDNLLDLAEQNPKYKAMLEKSLVLIIGGFTQTRNREIIASWPDALESSGGVDTVATLDERVKEEGVEVLREFDDTEFTALDVMTAMSSIAFSFTDFGSNAQSEQLQDIALESDWNKQVSGLLLNSDQ